MTPEERETRDFVKTRLQRGLSLLRALSLRERFWKSLLSSETIFLPPFYFYFSFFYYYYFIVYIFILFYFINIQLNN